MDISNSTTLVPRTTGKIFKEVCQWSSQLPIYLKYSNRIILSLRVLRGLEWLRQSALLSYHVVCIAFIPASISTRISLMKDISTPNPITKAFIVGIKRGRKDTIPFQIASTTDLKKLNA